MKGLTAFTSTKGPCGWLGKDDEGFGGSDTCSFEGSCGADGVVGPV